VNLQAELIRNYNSYLSDSIKVYEGVFASDWCEDLIQYFRNSLHQRTDDHIDYKNELFERLYPLGSQYEKHLHALCHPDYKPHDRPLTNIYNTGFRSLQIQRYKPEDKGYPAVHIESGPEHYKKYLAVIVYLNDVASGGETIFPMAGTTIKPRVGSVAIWPAGLPFYHCGLQSKTTKYILTSWFEFM
jgi:hypothetical protein